MDRDTEMTFKEALKKLGIEEYGERIFNSNSHGELFHLDQYITMAKHFEDLKWFPKWFKAVVLEAKETWKRPESVFQHIARILSEQFELEKQRESNSIP